jgi:anti-sigma factor RsiW
MSICDLFDRYRDGELNASERSAFESHLGSCEDCQMKKSLLDHVVLIVRREVVQPVDLASQIAHRAFLRRNSWASAVVSWLHPLPAMVALVVMLVLFSSLWIISGSGKVSAYSEYEQLIEAANAENLDDQLSQPDPNTAIVDWLEQEANPR